MSSLYPKIKRNLLGAYAKIFLSRLQPVSQSTSTSPLSDPYGSTARLAASNVGGFNGKRILDVGCDTDGLLVSSIAQQYSDSEAIGINPRLPARSILPNCRLEPIDIRATPYPNDYFDCVLSVSAFEHILDLNLAFTEMLRILKPGGFLFSHFGPIYSASFGHHLWMAVDGKTYNYHNTILPPYCHLLMSPEALLSYCVKRLDPLLSEQIVEFVFYSTDQNRLSYDDYLRIVQQSYFEVVYFNGINCPDIDEKYLLPDLPKTLSQLRSKYPHNTEYLYDGIVMLLKKPISG